MVLKFRRGLSSQSFFWLTISFFVVQSAWIACSALYPQAFDEQFHFGIIQVYSKHWLPFLKTQPPNADPFGAVTRDPSFFFHYAMSFPYRLIEHFTSNQTEQVIFLRFIDVGLFTAGLILFRRVLKRAGLSDMATNVSIFLVTLIPVAPQLAGQINYDNMLVPMTAWACLLTFNVIDQLGEKRIRIQTLLGLLAVCLIASIVKYEFLPIFLGIAIFVVVFAVRHLKGHWKKTLAAAWADWRKGNASKWLILVAFLAAFTLFAQRDLGNILMYHTVVPDCSEVLTIQDCSAYSVWLHDYDSHQLIASQAAIANPDPIVYFGEWSYWLWYRLFFAINGQASGFRNYPPLPLPAAAFVLLLLASIYALIRRGRQTFRGKPYISLLGLVVGVYLLTLLGAGFQKYLSTGVLELMNGRYLFPILLPGIAVAIPALTAVARDSSPLTKYLLIGLVMFCFLEGGGVFTFISRSDNSWYWPNPSVQRMNRYAKDIFEPLIIDGPNTYGTNRWFFN